VSDIPEIKSHLMNVYNSLNFLKKIGVPVIEFNEDIRKIMALMKKGELDEAKVEVLDLRRRTSDILSRMENINRGLLEIEKEISALLKKGINTVPLRRLYSQCRLSLKEGDYDQVQLFIIKMEKIIDMYHFLSGETILVDVDEGEEMEDVVTRLVLEAVRTERGDAACTEEQVMAESGRYAEDDEDIPVLVPIYEDMDEDDLLEAEEVSRKTAVKEGKAPPDPPKSPGEYSEVIGNDGQEASSPPETQMIEAIQAEEAGVERTDPRASLEELKEAVSEMGDADTDVKRGIEVLDRLIRTGDEEGAEELANELINLLQTNRKQSALESLNALHREAREALVGLTGGREAPKDIRRMYDRAKLLRERGEFDIASRLFREVTIMCREGRERAITEELIRRLDELRSDSERFSDQLTDPKGLEEKLKKLSDRIERGNTQDVKDILSSIERMVDRARASYWKEEVRSLERELGRRNTANFDDETRGRFKRMLSKISEFKEGGMWEDAHRLLVKCDEEIRRERRLSELEKELHGLDRDLTYLPEGGTLREEMERMLEEASKRILFRDAEGTSAILERARVLASDEMARSKSGKNLGLLRERIGELPEGELKQNFMDRYYEAKSKNDEGRFKESLKRSTEALNEITMRALREISGGQP